MLKPIYAPPAVTYHYQPMSVVGTAGRPWHLTDRSIPASWSNTGGGQDVRIAVLDSGVEATHGGIKRSLAAVESTLGCDGGDRFGHGTHMAGLLVDSLCGCAPNAQILSIKVLGDSGVGDDNSIISGIERAVVLKADILSISIGGATTSPKMVKAIEAAWKAGLVILAASGNEAATRLCYPAALDPYVLAVGAIDRQKHRAGFSNFDAKASRLDLVDYGQEVRTCAIGNRYAVISGTSAATAMAAGAMANLISLRKQQGSWSSGPVTYIETLQSICDDLGQEGLDKELGWGLINYSKLI